MEPLWYTDWQQVAVPALELPRMGLNGRLVAEFGDLSDLLALNLRHKRLAGPIPHELDTLNLYSLRVADNDIAGAVMSELDGLIGAPFKSQRLLLWRLGFEKAMEAPLFGHGLGTLRRLDSAPIGNDGEPLGVHNLYLRLLGEAGIVPALLFVLSILLLLRSQWRKPKSLARDAAAGWVVAIAVYGMTFQHLLTIAAFMFMAELSVTAAIEARA